MLGRKIPFLRFLTSIEDALVAVQKGAYSVRRSRHNVFIECFTTFLKILWWEMCGVSSLDEECDLMVTQHSMLLLSASIIAWCNKIDARGARMIEWPSFPGKLLYIYIYTHVHMYTHTYVYVYIYIYIKLYINKHISLYVCTGKCAGLRVGISSCDPEL